MSGVRPGSTVVDGKYRIEKRLGAGGMGAVYLATHLGTSRPVALKLIVPQFARDSSFIERFKREARAAGRLRHPNIVDVTDFGLATLDGQQVAYLVMEYLDGCSLEDVLDEEPKLPLRWTVDFFEQFAMAVDEAHRKGIVHRDLKPSNVWLEPGLRGGYTVKVLDFGLAKLADTPASDRPESDESRSRSSDEDSTLPGPLSDRPDLDSTLPGPTAESTPSSEAPTLAPGGAAAPAPVSEIPERPEPDDLQLVDALATASTGDLTKVGTVMGTPRYMAPEQCRGEIVGHAADVYSMGVILYEMLAGAPPFDAPDADGLIKQQLEKTPAPLATVNPDVPEGVSELVMSALAKDPVERPATARLFAEQLRAKADTSGTLIQRGLVMAFERFRTFLTIALAVVAPQAVLVAIMLVVDAMARAGSLDPVTHVALATTLWIADVFVGLLAAVVSRGVVVLVIAQALLAPLREVRVRFAYDALVRYLGPSLLGATTILAYVVVPVVLGYLAISWSRTVVGGAMVEYLIRLEDPAGAVKAVGAFLVGVGLWYFALRKWAELLQLPNVILVESLSGRRAIERSRELANRSWHDTLTIGLVTLAAPALTMALFEGMKSSVAGVAADVLLALAMLAARVLNAAILPVLVGVLYLKLRQANAEPIDDLLAAQFVTEEAPKTRWERRLDIAPYRSGLGRD